MTSNKVCSIRSRAAVNSSLLATIGSIFLTATSCGVSAGNPGFKGKAATPVPDNPQATAPVTLELRSMAFDNATNITLHVTGIALTYINNHKTKVVSYSSTQSIELASLSLSDAPLPLPAITFDVGDVEGFYLVLDRDDPGAVTLGGNVIPLTASSFADAPADVGPSLKASEAAASTITLKKEIPLVLTLHVRPQATFVVQQSTVNVTGEQALANSANVGRLAVSNLGESSLYACLTPASTGLTAQLDLAETGASTPTPGPQKSLADSTIAGFCPTGFLRKRQTNALAFENIPVGTYILTTLEASGSTWQYPGNAILRAGETASIAIVR